MPSTPDPGPRRVAPVPEPSPLLRVRGLSKRYGRDVVLDGVDLDVAPGEVVWLVGSNGSGKSTLLRCLAGLASHDGEVTVDRDRDGGRRGRASRRRAWLGYLPQAPGLPTWATATDVLALFSRLRGTSSLPSGMPDGLLPPLDRPLGKLSGGQRQRVAIVVAFLGDPRVVLLDEPAANLDAGGVEALGVLVNATLARGGSVLVASPVAGTPYGVTDRFVRLVDGRVVDEAVAGRVDEAVAGRVDEAVADRVDEVIDGGPDAGTDGRAVDLRPEPRLREVAG